MKKITVAIIDDHLLIREMCSNIFAGHNQFEITGESGALDEAIEMIKIKRPDIVLLDINLEKSSGLDAMPLIRKFSPGSRIIVVSMHNQPAYVKKMLQLGAKGYVTKNSSHEEILKAAKEVMKGNIYVCTEIKNILSDQMLSDEPAETSVRDLTFREIEIVRFIKEGFSSKEISSKLHIATRTVEVHRHNILKKLMLKNTASLINFINNTDLSFD